MNRQLKQILVMLGALFALPAVATAQNLDEARDCVIGPHRVVDVSSAVPGLLKQVLVDRSDTVSAGQLVARLESQVEQASLALADAWASIESEVRMEETTGALDRRRENRISQLYASHAVALDDKDEAETEVALAALRLRQAREKRWIRELDARKAEATLQRRDVRSPIDGVVAERFRSAGEYVENQPVLRIAQLDPLQVETILPMTLFGQVSEGMVAKVHPENDPDAGHQAVVSVVDRLGDAASGTFGVRLSLANPGNRIPAGLKCSLSFVPGMVAPVPFTAEPGPAVDPGAGDEVPARSPSSPAEPVEADVTPSTPMLQTRASDPSVPVDTVATAPVAPVSAVVKSGTTDPDAGAVVATSAGGAVSTHGTESGCMAFGPLDSENAAAVLAETLAGHGVSVTVDREKVFIRIGFIVVTPRQPDLAATGRLHEALGRAGLRDRSVMYRGGFTNRVSLGVYDAVGMAELRRDEVLALGAEAEVLERRRSREQWWVRARSVDAQAEQTSLQAVSREVAVPARACSDDGIRSAELPRDVGATS